MGPRCSSAETQVCHRSYIIAASLMPVRIITINLVTMIGMIYMSNDIYENKNKNQFICQLRRP
jgi:hypothetical protein